ncbi:MAG: hypothetical protein ACRD17_05250 [Terriglobales bacterium]
MRFSANLARAPRENRRRAWVLWGSACGVAAAVLVVLAAITIGDWHAAATVRARTDLVQARIAPLRRQRVALTGQLSQPGAHATIEQAQYLNQLIDQKAVSWTRLFERLEALLPAQVQLLSIRPAEQEGRTALEMIVAAPSVSDALPFIRQLEEAPDFAAPHVSEVSQRPGPGGAAADRTNAEPASGIRLAIVADYNPRLGPANLPAAAPRAAAPARRAAAQPPGGLLPQ